MTMPELVAKHGRVTPKDLPKKSGPKWGTRVFSDEEEEQILIFVLAEENAPELAAVHCGVSKTSIDNIIARVKKRLGLQTNEAPTSGTGTGLSASSSASEVASSVADVVSPSTVSA